MELLKKKATLGRVIQIVEHFEMDEEWAKLLNKEFERIVGEEQPEKKQDFMFLEVESGPTSSDLFNSLKDRELITREEVMVLLSISSATVSRWQADGILKAYSVAKTSRVYFRFSEIIDSLVELRPHS